MDGEDDDDVGDGNRRTTTNADNVEDRRRRRRDGTLMAGLFSSFEERGQSRVKLRAWARSHPMQHPP